MLKDFGAPLSIATHVVILTPLQPLRGLITAWLLVQLTNRTQSIFPGIVARCLALGIASQTAGPHNLASAGLLLLIAGLMWWIPTGDRSRSM